MKKVQKLFLLGVFCLASVIFIDKASALDVEYQYPVFGNGNTILFDKTHMTKCYNEYSYCHSYLISEDDGIKDSDIKLTNVTDSSDTILIGKEPLSGGYVLSATDKIDIYLRSEINGEIGDGGLVNEYITNEDVVTKVKYFNETSDVKSMIQNAKKYDTFMLRDGAMPIDMIVPKDVTVMTGGLVVNTLVNNGTIKTGWLITDKISGNGTINLVYTESMGDGPTSGTPVDDAMRLNVKDVTGVKVNILKADIKEGTSFGIVGKTSDYTKEEAQTIIDMYNKILGSSMNGYELELAKYDVYGDEEYYYGILVKEIKKQEEIKNTEKQDAKSDAKEEIKNNKVKNPSTGDAIILTIAALITSGAVFMVTYKKAKQK